MDLAERLVGLRNSKGLSQDDLAGATKLNLEQIRNIEDSSDATISELIEISTYFKADLNWFIMGAGYESLEMDYIVMIDSKAAAGYLEHKDDPTYFSQLEYYRIPGFNKRGNHRIFLVHGDSMQPTLLQDDHLVCSEVKDVNQLEDGDLAVLVTKSDIVVKRLRFDGDVLLLESDNPKFKTYILDKDEIDEIWKVDAKVTKLIEKLQPASGYEIDKLSEKIREMKKQMGFFKSELADLKKRLGEG